MVKVVNTLTQSSDILKTCIEESIENISDRYLSHNKHAKSYTWKQLVGEEFVPIRMDWTLSENGLPDDSDSFVSLGLDEDFNMPTLHIYYNDDLTIA